jgi:hypothetical protein
MRSSVQGLRSISNNRWRLLLPALAIVALGFLGMGASAASAAGDPFVASISGSLTQESSDTFRLKGAGISRQLGNFDYAGTVVVTGSVNSLLTAISDTLTETLTFVANNGDTLTLECLQAAGQISGDLGPVYHGQDRWVVIGGTGQFKNATGSGTGDTYVDLAGGFVKVLSGTITKK